MMKTERPAPLAMPRNRLLPFVLLLSSCVSPAPIGQPSTSPTAQPSTAPTAQTSPAVPGPTASPTSAPVASPSPSAIPTVTPTPSPIPTASASPSSSPSPSVSPSPSSGPIVNPGETPAATSSPNLGTTSVIGTIRAKDGPLLTGVAVQIRPLNSSVKFEASTTSVGGKYRFDNVPVGQQFTLLTLKSGYQPLQRLTTTPAGTEPETRPVNFELIAR